MFTMYQVNLGGEDGGKDFYAELKLEGRNFANSSDYVYTSKPISSGIPLMTFGFN